MITFEDIDDLKEWLEPMGYDAFTKVRGKNVDPWPGWIRDAQEGFDFAKAKALKLKWSTVDSLAQRNNSSQQGDLVFALAGHYRLHMHLYEDHLSYAYDLDNHVFKDGPYPFDEDIFVLDEHENSEVELSKPSALAEIEDAGWNQMPKGAEESEFSVRVRYNVLNKVFDGRDLQFGLKQAMMQIRPQDFKITREYCSYSDRLNGSYIRDGKLRWVSTEPRDNYQMLRGTSVAGPVCIGTPEVGGDASLEVDLFARSSEFELAITELSSLSRVSAENDEKAYLIQRVFGIYLQKLNQIDAEHTLLETKKISL